MKKTKVIIPALGILLLSTAASVTGTVAWFSANSSVTATGMKVQAKAEQGIVISNEEKSAWSDKATASHHSGIELLPTSTAIGAEWYHNNSNDEDDAAAAQAASTYSVLDIKEDDGAGFVDSATGTYANDQYDATAGENAYYLINKFYIKTSSGQSLDDTHVYLNYVRGSVTGTSASEYLNKALRVLVVFTDGTTTVQKVYAPFAGATLTYKAKNTTDVTAIDASAGKVGTDLGEFDIPANDTTAYPMVASVYVYFEGEDANCKSKNLKATLDELNVELEFGLIQAE